MLLCERCGYGMLHPRPTPEQVAEFYRVDYYTHEREHSSAFAPGPLDRLRQHLAFRLDSGRTLDAELIGAQLPGRLARICEIGCGNGRLLEDLRKLGHSVVGVEPDEAARSVARAAGLEVHEGRAEDLPSALREGSYDVVIMRHVLEHCLDPLRALERARALLRREGQLFCETPNCDALGLSLANVAWQWFDAPRHLNFFSASSLRKACERAGFSVLETEYTGYFRQLERAWIDAEARIEHALWPERGDARRRAERRAWLLLLRTAFAAPERKYDSVRVLAVPA